MTVLARYLSIWLREHLPVDRAVSPSTIDAYSQTLSALLRFAAERLGRSPSELALKDLDAPLILAFLEEIERRGVSVRTRNARRSRRSSASSNTGCQPRLSRSGRSRRSRARRPTRRWSPG